MFDMQLASTEGWAGYMCWCWKHYQEYIQQKPEWLRAMNAYAQRERRRMAKEYFNISIDWLAEEEYMNG